MSLTNLGVVALIGEEKTIVVIVNGSDDMFGTNVSGLYSEKAANRSPQYCFGEIKPGIRCFSGHCQKQTWNS